MNASGPGGLSVLSVPTNNGSATEGITPDELERAVSGYRVLSTQLYEQRDSAQDIEFANRIVAHHLLVEQGDAHQMLATGDDLHAGRGRAVITVDEGRITSYNVCYTKLLRLERSGSSTTFTHSPRASDSRATAAFTASSSVAAMTST